MICSWNNKKLKVSTFIRVQIKSLTTSHESHERSREFCLYLRENSKHKQIGENSLKLSYGLFKNEFARVSGSCMKIFLLLKNVSVL